jgi:hypothetical protein
VLQVDNHQEYMMQVLPVVTAEVIHQVKVMEVVVVLPDMQELEAMAEVIIVQVVHLSLIAVAAAEEEADLVRVVH